MTNPVLVDDVDDERIALYRNLKDRDLRQRKGLFLAESELVVERLVGSPFRLRSVLLHPQRAERMHELLADLPVPVFVAQPAVMDAIAGFPVHRGVLALAERGEPRDWRMLAAAPGPLLVLEEVGDPDNIGALFRMAAAFGYGAVLVSPGTADPLYRKAIRSSMGWSLRVPFAELPDWPSDLGRIDREVFALTPSADAEELRGMLVCRPHALLVGAEGPGLTAQALAAASRQARIPMADGVDSLNVAVAAAIAMYELGALSHRSV